MARQGMEIRGETVEEKIQSIGVILKKLWVQITVQRAPTPMSVLSYAQRPLEDGLISSHLIIADGHIHRIGVRVGKLDDEEINVTCSVIDHRTGDRFLRFITIKDEFSIIDDSIQVQKGNLVMFHVDSMNVEDISISFLYNMPAKSLIETGAF